MQLTKRNARAVLCRWCANKGDRERRFDWYENIDGDTPRGRNGRSWIMVDRATSKTHSHHYNGDLKPAEDVSDKIAGNAATSSASPSPMPTTTPNVESLAEAVAAALRPRIERVLTAAQSDLAELRLTTESLIAERIAEIRVPQRVEIVRTDTGETKDMGVQHAEFPRLVRYLATRRVNVMMVGPAGSGKTVAAEQAAKALGVPFYPKSLGPSTREHEFSGFQGPAGMIHGILREPFVNGGCLLLDEMDRANPAVLTILNAALANRYFSFPDGVQERHPDFVCIAAANTWGMGADRQYVGAAQLDASTLNRFVMIPWDYDEQLENSIADGYAAQAKDQATKDRLVAWRKRVQAIRKAVFTTKTRIVVSPRATIYGSILILAGDTSEQAEQATIWASVSADDRSKVLANVR